MDINDEFKDDFLAQIDDAIERGNVDKETLELMKELLKGAKLRCSISAYYEDQEYEVT